MARNGYPKSGIRTPEAKAQREAHWRAVLDRWRTSGLPKTEFARRERISPDVLGWWQVQIQKRDLVKRRQTSATSAARPRWKAAPRPAAFVPVRVLDVVRRSAGGGDRSPCRRPHDPGPARLRP